ncbi:MAG: YdgA family protein [Syntrophobacteraceae bacterium]|nr:YdgA family protein [Syntrophobacteraceae bacterium]
MKKTVAIVVSVLLALALCYVGVSYWIGGRALQFHDQSIARINGSKGLKAEVLSYKRGLFSSRALTKLTLVLPRQGREISIDLVDTIYHGPFVFLRDPRLKGGLRPVMAVIRTSLEPGGADMGKALRQIPELASSEALTVLSINGDAVSYFGIPSFQHEFKDAKGEQMEVKWGGLSGKFHFDAQAAAAVCTCDCPSLLVTGKNRKLQIAGVRGQFDSHAGIKGISVGSSHFSIGSIEAVENGQSAFTLASLGLKTKSMVEGDKINGSIRLGFGKLNAGGLGVGPFSMDFEARKLDASVLARFEKLAPALQREEMGNDEAAKAQMRGLFAKMAADLLAGRPELEIKQLNLRTDKGDLTGKARLGFDGDGKEFSRNILALLTSVNANAQLSVSQALFYFIAQNAIQKNRQGAEDQSKDSAGQLAARLLAAKYITADSGAFTSSAAFKHGVLTVNGHRLGFSNLR